MKYERLILNLFFGITTVVLTGFTLHNITVGNFAHNLMAQTSIYVGKW